MEIERRREEKRGEEKRGEEKDCIGGKEHVVERTMVRY
jgi:hypothetical protein